LPVARNLVKMRKLGMKSAPVRQQPVPTGPLTGPLPSFSSSKGPPDLPSLSLSKGPPDRRRPGGSRPYGGRRGDNEVSDHDGPDQRSGGPRPAQHGAVSLSDMFDVSEGKKERPKKKTGLPLGQGRLGPVQPRPEEVDPLEYVPRRRDDGDNMSSGMQPSGLSWPPGTDPLRKEENDQRDQPWRDPVLNREMIKAALHAEEMRKELEAKESLKQQARKRGLHPTLDTGATKRPDPAKRLKPGDNDGRSPSPSPDPEASGSGGDKLLSEAEVVALMQKKNRNSSPPRRGSAHAQQRIRKEQEKWERKKANNPEYWKAPKFAQVLARR